MCHAPIPAVGDSLCGHDESAMSSAGEPLVSSVPSVVLPSVSSVLHCTVTWEGYGQVVACDHLWSPL